MLQARSKITRGQSTLRSPTQMHTPAVMGPLRGTECRWTQYAEKRKLKLEIRNPSLLQRFVLKEVNPFRQKWSTLVTALLAWIGTVVIWRISFVDLAVCKNSCLPQKPSQIWELIDFATNCIFMVDLVIMFFFSYRDVANIEVCDVRRTAVHYLRTAFLVNLLACLPPEFIEFIFSANSGNSTNQGFRLLRFRRLTKLFRILRISRLGRMIVSWGSQSSHITHTKGVHLVHLVIILFWIVHILACGYYLVAGFHTDHNTTWVARRVVNNDQFLIDRPAFEQWIHAMYFIVTVFTTVGFGDISAYTTGESVYLIFLMCFGVVVHSIIISEVIEVVTNCGRVEAFIRKQTDLIDKFSVQVGLGRNTKEDLSAWIYLSAGGWSHHSYCKDDVRQLIAGRNMPPSLLETLPAALFDGRLLKNRLLRQDIGSYHLPPRFPIMVALNLSSADHAAEDVIYETQEYPCHLYLVISGIFAFIAHPPSQGSGRGGQTTLFDVDCRMNKEPYKLLVSDSFFGEVELFASCPRKSAVRCERAGTTLSLSNLECKSLMTEFPEFVRVWQRKSQAQEKKRLVLLEHMTPGLNAESLAYQALKNHTKILVDNWRERAAPRPMQRMMNSEYRKSWFLNTQHQPDKSRNAFGRVESLASIKASELRARSKQEQLEIKIDKLCEQVGELAVAVNLLSGVRVVNT